MIWVNLELNDESVRVLMEALEVVQEGFQEIGTREAMRKEIVLDLIRGRIQEAIDSEKRMQEREAE